MLFRSLGSVQGYTLQLSLRPWLSARLEQHVELLYEWVSRMFEEIDMARTEGVGVDRQEATLRNALDAFTTLQIPLAGRIPENVLQWYDQGRTTGEPAWT